MSLQGWQLLQMGFPLERLVEVWEELRMVPWSTKGVEELHAGAATVKKMHPEIFDDMLACRSFLYGFRGLLAVSREEKHLAALRNNLDKMHARSRRMGHVHGLNLFIADLFRQAKSSSNAPVPDAGRKLIFTEAARLYHQLDLQARLAYDRQAQHKSQQHLLEAREAQEDLQQRLSLESSRVAQQETCKSPWVLSAHTLSPSERLRFQALCADPALSRSRVQQRRQLAGQAAPLPSMELKLRLFNHTVAIPEKPPLQAWVRDVCRQRDRFQGKVLCVHHDSPNHNALYFFVAWAYINPYLLALIQLKRVPLVVDASGGPSRNVNDHRFQFEIMESHWTSDDSSFWPAAAISVIPIISCLANFDIVSVLNPVSLDDFLEPSSCSGPEHSTSQPRAYTSTAGPSARARFVQEHPWALQFMNSTSSIPHRAPRTVIGNADAAMDDDPLVVGDVADGESSIVVDVDDLFAGMDAAKERVGQDVSDLFRVKPLMGGWTLANTGCCGFN